MAELENDQNQKIWERTWKSISVHLWTMRAKVLRTSPYHIRSTKEKPQSTQSRFMHGMLQERNSSCSVCIMCSHMWTEWLSEQCCVDVISLTFIHHLKQIRSRVNQWSVRGYILDIEKARSLEQIKMLELPKHDRVLHPKGKPTEPIECMAVAL